VLVEKRIKGKKITVAILEREGIEALVAHLIDRALKRDPGIE
jgi:hypothetical protein